MRHIEIPDDYASRIQTALSRLGYSLSQPDSLAKAIQRLSTFYIEQPDSPTPWHETWAQAAYVAYFFPLNYARVAAVVHEGHKLGFFAGLTRLLDFGSGLGTVPLVLRDRLGAIFRDSLAIERRSEPERLYIQLAGERAMPLAWSRESPRDLAMGSGGSLTAFSFSLTELSTIPAWAMGSEALMLIEPATHQDARRLHGWREMLSSHGFRLWAPCTHEQNCPLLTHSSRDWCHDRVVWRMPTWFEDLSEHLPMRNPTLTMSYLLARKAPPPAHLGGLGRLTGDLKREKGASRQMVCRGPEREFLSWQKRDGAAPEWPKGALVRIAADIAAKGHELRPIAGQVSLCQEDDTSLSAGLSLTTS